MKTPTEKATELIAIFSHNASKVVDEIINALQEYDEITESELKEIDYNSFLLQNMEFDFRYWDKVKAEINRIKLF